MMALNQVFLMAMSYPFLGLIKHQLGFFPFHRARTLACSQIWQTRKCRTLPNFEQTIHSEHQLIKRNVSCQTSSVLLLAVSRPHSLLDFLLKVSASLDHPPCKTKALLFHFIFEILVDPEIRTFFLLPQSSQRKSLLSLNLLLFDIFKVRNWPFGLENSSLPAECL